MTLAQNSTKIAIFKNVETIGDETRIVRHEAQEGFGQGAPESTLGFTKVIQPDILLLRELLRKHGGESCFCADDGFVDGPRTV